MKKDNKIALAEVNEVLKKSSIEVIKKIPYRVRKGIVKNMDKEISIALKENIPLVEQGISEQAKIILTLIYRDYLTSQ